MQQATVRTIYEYINSIAPFDTQEEGDNSGLLVGSMAQEVDSVLLALDVTPQVLEEAQALNAQLIVSHHPLMFAPVQSLLEDDYEGALLSRLIREGRALISAHTNADQSEVSGTLAMAHLLGLQNLRREGPYVWVGELPQDMPVKDLCCLVADTLGGTPVAHGPVDHRVHTLAVVGGSYSEGYREAALLGAQALLTGEVRHHHALQARAQGMVLISAGHAETEMPMLHPLARGLQAHLNQLQYKVAVYVSTLYPYGLK